MKADATAPTVQTCRTCGGLAPLDAHFCPQCTRILSLGRHGDYFAFFGIPRKLNLDAGDLEQRFRTLSRQFHPDYFYNASPSERRASLERSSYLNDAYRTLRQPISRLEYLLRLESGDRSLAVRPDGASRGFGDGVPASLLEEVFALNEELDEVRELRAAGAPPKDWRARFDRARRPIEAKRAAHETELQALSARWDVLVEAGAPAAERQPVLDALRERMLEGTYINNLLAGIERETTLK